MSILGNGKFINELGLLTYTNWNLYPRVASRFSVFSGPEDWGWLKTKNEALTPRGNGRSYGDASLGKHICSALHFNKILRFNREAGILTAQSGILFSDLLQVIIPAGWFLPVTPGTQFITLGGAVAADVHGKNHHSEGSFSRYIDNMEILLPDGRQLTCSKTQNPELFRATCGGMGLTGVILRVTIILKKIETSKIVQRTIKSRNLDEVLDLFEQHKTYTYSVAWIDCLKKGRSFGRSILTLGEHAKGDEIQIEKSRWLELPKKSKITIPFHFPGFVLNTFTVKIFNFLYYGKTSKKDSTSITDYETFFYPLDAILHWNRIYGKGGFLQYQFVVPKTPGNEGLKEILNRITQKGWGSFLAVLKLFGPEDEGYISFPMEGYTLALDFPIKKGLFEFLDELDRVILNYGGRIYLAKDARMKPEIFKQSYPEYARFMEVVDQYNPGCSVISSHLAQRLELHKT